MSSVSQEPIVILGGFMGLASLYAGLSLELAALSGRQVVVVDTRIFDWLTSASKVGWYLVLTRLDQTVNQALLETTAAKAILIAHSQGGILSRLYLNPQPFADRRFAGLERISHLITLGSPHLNQGGITRGGRMSRFVNRRLPGAAYSPQVRYTSIAGQYIRGSRTGTNYERFAYRVYKEICGDGQTWGDGIVPVSSALLPGSHHIVLPGVSHYSLLGEPWYGSPEVLPRWWEPISAPENSDLD